MPIWTRFRVGRAVSRSRRADSISPRMKGSRARSTKRETHHAIRKMVAATARFGSDSNTAVATLAARLKVAPRSPSPQGRVYGKSEST